MPTATPDFDPLRAALVVLVELRRLYPLFGWRLVSGERFWIDMLTGSNLTRLQIDAGASPDEIMSLWRTEGGLDEFEALREPFLLYS